MADFLFRRRWLLFVGMGIVYAVAYWPLVDAGFIWDDDDYILHNDTLRDAGGLYRMWFQRGALPQYYPLAHTTFWVEFQIWNVNALGYHAVNWVLHGVNAILVYHLLSRLGIRVAAIAAFVFAVHPVHVESVAWVTERKNVLSGLFYLASWLVWLRFASSRRIGSWCVALVLFAAALLSKSVTASLPAAILLVNWWRDGGIARRDVVALLPFFLVGIAAGLHTAWIEMYDLRGTGEGATGEEWSLSIAERVLVAGRAFWFYPTKVMWPDPLSFIYPRWELDTGSLLQWLFPIGMVLAITILFALRTRLGRAPLTVALFHGGTLLPALGFLNVYPFRYSFVADHFQYLASLGATVLALALLRRAVTRLPDTVILAVLAAALVPLTFRHARVFEGLETLWNDTIAKNEKCWMAHNNLGGIYYRAGDMQSATLHFERALHYKPDHKDAKLSLGLIALSKRDVDRAEALFREVLAAAPEFGPAWANLGVLLATRKQSAPAEDALRKALLFQPGYSPARQNLARLLLNRGDAARALEVLEAGVRLSPYDGTLIGQSAFCLMKLGRIPEARSRARKALTLDPRQPEALRVLRE